MKYLFLIIAVAYTMLIAYFMKPVPDQIDLITFNGVKYGISLNSENLWSKISLILVWVGYILYSRKR